MVWGPLADELERWPGLYDTGLGATQKRSASMPDLEDAPIRIPETLTGLSSQPPSRAWELGFDQKHREGTSHHRQSIRCEERQRGDARARSVDSAAVQAFWRRMRGAWALIPVPSGRQAGLQCHPRAMLPLWRR